MSLSHHRFIATAGRASMRLPFPSAASLCALVMIGFSGAVGAQVPEREANVVVYGDDPCPAAADPEEIVVCARRPEEERYRIPREFRRTAPAEIAWGTRATELEDAQRDTRPDSCSVVGSHGQTGCTRQWIDAWAAERREASRRRRR